MTKEEKAQKEQRETPIIDGDARPDMPINPENKKAKRNSSEELEGQQKVSTERGSDINSLEDYKDSK
jgi:hypothetical protein